MTTSAVTYRYGTTLITHHPVKETFIFCSYPMCITVEATHTSHGESSYIGFLTYERYNLTTTSYTTTTIKHTAGSSVELLENLKKETPLDFTDPRISRCLTLIENHITSTATTATKNPPPNDDTLSEQQSHAVSIITIPSDDAKPPKVRCNIHTSQEPLTSDVKHSFLRKAFTKCKRH